MQERHVNRHLSRLVLVVEDDDAVRHSLKFSLEIEGFPVREFSSAGALLNAPDIADASCMVIDYNLPDMNGLELLGKLRDRRINTPVLMITSWPGAAVRQGAAAAGVRIIEKPLLNGTLLDGVRGAIT